MPLIPASTGNTVAPAGADGAFQRIDARADAFGAGVAQAGMGVARSLDQASSTVTENVLRFQAIQNETQVNDAYSNDFSPKFRDLYQKYYALQGKDAVAQMGSFQDKMQELRGSVRDALPNDVQRKLFDQASRRRVEMEMDGMVRFADQQNKVYQHQTFTATLKTLRTDAADKYNDEQAFGTALGTGLAEIDRYTGSTGGSAEMARAQANEFVSQAWTDRISRMMLDNPMGARDLYRANQKNIDPAQRLVLEHHLRTATLPIEAKRTAEQVMGGRAAPDLATALTVAGDPLVSAVIAQESGGKQSAVSAKGAVGVMQVMPDTAREVAGEMGLEYDPEKLKTDAGYNKALGTRYLQKMLARYGGNQTLALAAYNAGPGQVDKWIATNGDPNAGQVSDADWAAKIPFKETRDYVARINAKAPGAPAPTMARDTRANLGNWIAEAEKMAQQQHPDDPVYRDLVISQVKGYVNTVVAAQEGIQKQNHDTLMKVALKTDQSGNAPMTLEQLLATPEAKNAWLGTDVQSQRGLLSLLDHNARAAQGVPIKTDPVTFENVWSRINAPATDPAKIRNRAQLAPFLAKGLNRADYDWFGKRIDEQMTEDGQRIADTRTGFFSAVKGQFDDSTMMKIDAIGGEDFYKFKQFALSKEREYRDAGKDIYALYNPGSPDYLGKQMGGFMRTEQQKLQAMAARMKANTPSALPPDQQRRPGESPEQYLTRTGGGK